MTNETLRKQNQRFLDQAGMSGSLYGSPYVHQAQSATLTETLINEAREEIEMDKRALNEAENKSMLNFLSKADSLIIAPVTP